MRRVLSLIAVLMLVAQGLAQTTQQGAAQGGAQGGPQGPRVPVKVPDSYSDFNVRGNALMSTTAPLQQPAAPQPAGTGFPPAPAGHG